jgi:hypothetical protein
MTTLIFFLQLLSSLLSPSSSVSTTSLQRAFSHQRLRHPSKEHSPINIYDIPPKSILPSTSTTSLQRAFSHQHLRHPSKEHSPINIYDIPPKAFSHKHLRHSSKEHSRINIYALSRRFFLQNTVPLFFWGYEKHPFLLPGQPTVGISSTTESYSVKLKFSSEQEMSYHNWSSSWISLVSSCKVRFNTSNRRLLIHSASFIVHMSLTKLSFGAV